MTGKKLSTDIRDRYISNTFMVVVVIMHIKLRKIDWKCTTTLQYE